MEDRYMSTTEAADYLGVSSDHLRASRQVGKKLLGRQPPIHYGSGRATRYKLSDLDKWMRAAIAGRV